MSDAIKHECGIALVRLKKPLQFYKDKYGTAFYGLNKMYLLMEKQHNRGQDGAGLASVKFNVEPGQRYISRVRSNKLHTIVFEICWGCDHLNKQNSRKAFVVAVTWRQAQLGSTQESIPLRIQFFIIVACIRISLTHSAVAPDLPATTTLPRAPATNPNPS